MVAAREHYKATVKSVDSQARDSLTCPVGGAVLESCDISLGHQCHVMLAEVTQHC